MRRFLLFIVLCVLLLICITACHFGLDQDTDELQLVFVECILTQEPVQQLTMYYTKGQKSKPVSSTAAEVVLTDLTVNKVVGHFTEKESGIWTLDYTAVPTHEYKLNVSIDSYRKISATQTMPARPIVIGWRYVLPYVSYWESPYGYHWAMDPDQVAEHPFMNSLVWNDGDGLPKGESYYIIYDVPESIWIKAMNYNPVTGKREIAEQICTSSTNVDNFNITDGIYVPPVKTIQCPYEVKEEYKGIMDGFHEVALYPSLSGAKIHKQYLRIPAQNRDRPMFMAISGDFIESYNCQNYLYYSKSNGVVRDLADYEGYLSFMAVSNDYDLFLLDNSNSNIEGGIGIFGCVAESKLQWSDEYTYTDIEYRRYPYELLMYPERSRIDELE